MEPEFMQTNAGQESKGGSSPAFRAAWETLENTGWLGRRSSRVRSLLKPTARLRTFAAGDALYLEDDPSNGVFGLVTGALEIAIPRMDGEECLLHRAEPGFWVGDLALFAGQRRLVTVRAAAPSTVVHLSQEALGACIKHHPELSRDFYELSHENMRTALQLLGNLAIQSAESRIALRLLLHADALGDKGDWIRLSHDDLAQLVAVSPKTVHRTLGRLQELGLIETGYSKIRVANYRELALQFGHALRSPASP
jgi:CRP-like cAMP-binding protein